MIGEKRHAKRSSIIDFLSMMKKASQIIVLVLSHLLQLKSFVMGSESTVGPSSVLRFFYHLLLVLCQQARKPTSEHAPTRF